MCIPSAPSPSSTRSASSQERFIAKIVQPISPPLALAILAAVVPSYCYLNRGFTQWFHWAGVYYMLTQWQFLERFQILSGFSICLGWYASLLYEFHVHDRFCHPLYKNMPSSLTQLMMISPENDSANNQQLLDFESSGSLLAMALAHILDFLAHPLLTYFFWRRHSARGGTLAQVLTWPVIVCAYLYSRLWSLTHTKYNTGEFGLWYFGFDVYVMDSLDSWYPAYIAESCVYGSVALWKILNLTSRDQGNFLCTAELQQDKRRKQEDFFEKKPNLLFSESTLSIDAPSFATSSSSSSNTKCL